MLAADFRAIGLTIAAIVFLGFIATFIWNIARARPELGSEIELAPNRKEYLSDEELEGEKLDRSLSFALVLLTLLAITLPFYWIAEPGRQEGAEEAYNLSFEVRGEETYISGAQCVNCHAAGGVGGVASYVLQDADGQFVANASWKAPALNNVLLRYGEDEVRYVLNFGRPGSPMAAWGTIGGGPLTTQQIDNVIIYLRTLQLQSQDPIDIAAAGTTNPQDEESLAALEEAQALEDEIRAEVQRSLDDGEYESLGEAVFNLGLQRDFGAGAYSCGRCHTSGWSLGLDVVPDVLDQGVVACGGGDPSGIGFALCDGVVKNHFPDDSWLRPDGSWYQLAQLDTGSVTEPVPGNPEGYDGTYIEAMDGTSIPVDQTGAPLTSAGEPYLVLEGEISDSATADEEASADTAESAESDLAGDVAECDYVSGLWQPQAGLAYPIAPDTVFETDPDTGNFIDPEPLDPADLAGDALVLEDGRIVSQCTIIDMPPRTSQAMYDFVYAGAEAGKGYGRGGLSSAGMMPGFGKILPPDLIQAVIDYLRGM
jgi:mono/diheme cytochrome c family protein